MTWHRARRGRRSAALAAVFGIVAAAAAGVSGGGGGRPALAQTGDPCNAVDVNSAITLTVSSPSADNPSPFRSVDVPFAGWAQHTGTAPLLGSDPQLRTVRVELVSCSPDYEPPANSTNLVQPGTGRKDFSWSAPFVRNGRYQASVIADGDQNQHSVRVRRFAVEVPPAKPTGVSAVAVSSKQVDVTWNANPEPDVRKYELWRTPGNSTTPTLITTTTASIHKASDTSVVPGNYTYFVRAIRPDADGNATVVSADSTHDPVTVASPNTPTTVPPPDTTTTTVRGGTGGSTTGSGTASGSGGSTTGTTTPGSGAVSPGATTGPTGTVDLSNFAALLDSRRRATTTKTEEADPGFGETLPFNTNDGSEGGPEQAGDASESARGLDDAPLDDGSDRRRSLAFFAGGLLLFVMSMSLLFVRGEVKRVDLLEAIDPDEPIDLDLEPQPEPQHWRAPEREPEFELSPLDVPLT